VSVHQAVTQSSVASAPSAQTLRPAVEPAAASHLLTAITVDLPQALVRDRLWAEPRLAQARARLHAGQAADRLLAECRVRVTQSLAAVVERSATPLNITYPESLPVSAARAEIQARIRERGCLVLVGETGSGKTTQLPKMLLELGYGRRGLLAMTQPRRLAAVAMAARIGEELVARPPTVVHSVRFDDAATEATVLRVMTDGLLLAEMARDPLLSRFEAIIIDEAHERSLNIDLLLALLRVLRRQRPELVVAVSSASIAAEAFAVHLGDDVAPAPIVQVGGRTFPVDIRWQPPIDDDLGYLAAAVSAIRSVHADEGTGDVLVFLPTERDILEASKRLHDLGGATVLPCFGRLSASEQQRIFSPVAGRKIVLATNIAETSLTIPGIVFVIDAGLARIKRFHQSTRTERLPVEPVAQASCVQRAGRAGRVQPGVCIRLYAEDDFARRPAFADPEILRANLAGVLLNALHFGVVEPEALPWLDPPSPQAWHQGWGQLDELGAAVPGERTLTALGRRMAALPVDPAVARILLAGITHGVPHEACTVAAFLSIQDPRVRPVGEEAKADAAHLTFRHEAGDLTTILQLWDQLQAEPSQGARARFAKARYLGVRRVREWADVRHQLWSVLRGQSDQSLPAHGYAAGTWPIDALHQAVLAGMVGNILMRDDQQRAYRTTGGREAHVHPGSALRSGKRDDGKKAPPPPGWLLACELVETTRLFARLCAPIDPEWVITLLGERCKRTYRDIQYDPHRRQVVATERLGWKGLTLRDGRRIAYERVDPVAATRCFAEALASEAGQDIAKDVPAVRDDQTMLARIGTLRARLRRTDLDIDASQVAAFYAERLEQASFPVASTAALRRYGKESGLPPIALDADALIEPGLLARADQQAPLTLLLGGQTVHIRYLFTPGESDDGATVTIREDQLAGLPIMRLADGIPAWWEDIIATWIRALSKDQRRHLQPIAQHAADIAAEISTGNAAESLTQRVHTIFQQRLGPCLAPDPALLDDVHRLRIRIIDSSGAELYAGRDLGAAFGLTPGGDPLAAARARFGFPPRRTWPEACATLPERIQAGGVTIWRGLARDRLADGGVGIRVAVFSGERAAKVWHADGVMALLEAELDDDLRRLAETPLAAGTQQMIERHLGPRVGGLRRSLAFAAASEGLGVVTTPAQFASAVVVAQRALPRCAEIDALLDTAARTAEALRGRSRRPARSLGEAAILRSVLSDLDRLLQPGWTTRLPWSATRRLAAHLKALPARLDRAYSDAASAQRLASRAEDMIVDVQHALGDDPRLLVMLGQDRAAQQLTADLEDCLLALTTPGASGALGFAEQRLRTGATTIAHSVRAARAAITAGRDRLLDARQIAGQIREERRRTVLVQEVERLLAEYPDRSLGADLDAQATQIAALIERARLLAQTSSAPARAP